MGAARSIELNQEISCKHFSLHAYTLNPKSLCQSAVVAVNPQTRHTIVIEQEPCLIDLQLSLDI